ncbi:MAG: hypothetical protein HY942_05405, partial [Gammaproteobacteria bacterium]|nr:hypothetical protein [Gammaproteobacteria bacterium]
TFGKPAIARLSDGTWAAIFGNGYNSTGDKAELFVVNILTGALIQKITTPGTGTPNGLASPTPLDTDSNHVVDYVYAGDLQGNIWKFNFTAATASGGVTISFGDNPLMQNIGQEITTAPKVAQNPVDGSYIVAFGTGKLLEDSDRTDTTTNYMYGIFDRANYTPATGWGSSPKLNVSTVFSQVDGVPPVFLRFIENTSTVGSGTLAGWALRLPNSTERVVNDPIIRSSRVTFTTVQPGVDFNQNWRMGVDYLTGKAPGVPYFDTNGDGLINNADKVDHDDDAGTAALVAIGQDEALGVVSGPVAARIANELDVVYVTHAEDAIITVNPFQDPGLKGGHFDVDNFNAVAVSTCTPGSGTTTKTDVTEKSMSTAEKTAYPFPDQTAIVTGPTGGVTVTTKMNTQKNGTLKKDKKQITTVTVTAGVGIAKCHVHQYDDQYNVNGVNLLYSVNTYDLDGTKRGTGLTLDGDTNLRELDRSDYGLSDVEVIISLVNPDPVMTTNPPVFNKVTRNFDPVPGDVDPGLIKFNRAGLGAPISVYTSAWKGLPAFNDLPPADRTAKVSDITQLEVSFTNINALRATVPDAPQNKGGTCGGVTGFNAKGKYRDGALVIRASRADTGEVVYETALYEHLKVDTLLAEYQAGAKVGCGEDAENLRQYKDPDKFVGADPGAGGAGTGVTVGGGGEGVGFSGTAGTGRGVYTGIDLGQHNWRELLLFR